MKFRKPDEWVEIINTVREAVKTGQSLTSVLERINVPLGSFRNAVERFAPTEKFTRNSYKKRNSISKKKENKYNNGSFVEFTPTNGLKIEIQLRGGHTISIPKNDEESLRTVLNILNEKSA